MYNIYIYHIDKHGSLIQYRLAIFILLDIGLRKFVFLFYLYQSIVKVTVFTY